MVAAFHRWANKPVEQQAHDPAVNERAGAAALFLGFCPGGSLEFGGVYIFLQR